MKLALPSDTAASMAPAHTQNQLLAALPAADWQALLPQLAWVELPLGALLYQAGGTASQVYFPVTATVSLMALMQNGASAEIAGVGAEGMVGLCASLAGGSSLGSAVVQHAGYALRMPAPALREACSRLPALQHQLLRYTHALFAQIAQTAACTRHHALDQQLCRWLLQHADQLQSQELPLTQDRIASLLGVRREGVTKAALALQQAGVIRYGRGRISLLDRNALAQRSCECYAVVRSALERLRAPEPVCTTATTAAPQQRQQAAARRMPAHWQLPAGTLQAA